MSYAYDYETQKTYEVNHAEYTRIAEHERLVKLGPSPQTRSLWRELVRVMFGSGGKLQNLKTKNALPRQSSATN